MAAGEPCDWDGDTRCASCARPATHRSGGELLCCWHATLGPDEPPPDWGAMERTRHGTMEARAAAARGCIDAIAAVRDVIGAGHPVSRRAHDGYREEWPALWSELDALCEAMEGWR